VPKAVLGCERERVGGVFDGRHPDHRGDLQGALRGSRARRRRRSDEVKVEAEHLATGADAQALHGRLVHEAAAKQVRDADSSHPHWAGEVVVGRDEDRSAVQAIVERACAAERHVAVNFRARLREDEVTILHRVNGLWQQHRHARRVDVVDFVVETKGNLRSPRANAEPISEAIVEVKPVKARVVVARGSEVAHEELNAGPQPVGELRCGVEPRLGELETSNLSTARLELGLRQIVVTEAHDVAGAHEPVELQRRHGSRDFLGFCSGNGEPNTGRRCTEKNGFDAHHVPVFPNTRARRRCDARQGSGQRAIEHRSFQRAHLNKKPIPRDLIRASFVPE
jgi:hypothetical protein